MRPVATTLDGADGGGLGHVGVWGCHGDWGAARLYKPNSVQQTGEILEFVYEGKLLIK